MRCFLKISIIFALSFSSCFLSLPLCAQKKETANDLETLSNQIGLDALFIQKVEVRLKEGTAKKPIKIKTSEIYLEEAIKYRFTLLNLNEEEGEPFLELQDRRFVLASTNDPLNRINGNIYFEFIAEEEDFYQLRFSSSNGKRINCSAIISMVLEDTTTVFDSRIGSIKDQGIETLYIGIENAINISASDVPEGYLEIGISNGEISGENGIYHAKFDKPGFAIVNVKSFKKDSTFQEESNTSFIVKDIPPPSISISGVVPGVLQKEEIDQLNRLNLNLMKGLHKPGYRIIEFMLGKDQFDYIGYKARGEFLTNSQKKFLINLQDHERFYLKHVVLSDPDGQLLYLKADQFIIN